MKIVNVVCRNCGASLQIDADKRNQVCNYCGNVLETNNSERSISNPSVRGSRSARTAHELHESSQRAAFRPARSTKHSLLWYLVWLCFFPVCLTIRLLKNETMNKKVRYGIIAAVWCLFLWYGISHSSQAPPDRARDLSAPPQTVSTDYVTENEIQANAIPILYADNSEINLWLYRYNSLYPKAALTADDFSVYNHHGSDHKDQITFWIDGFPIVLSSGKVVINCYKNDKTIEECKALFCKIVPIYCPGLDQEELQKRWETVMNDSTNTVTFDDDLDVYLQMFHDSIEMMTIDGKLQ